MTYTAPCNPQEILDEQKYRHAVLYFVNYCNSHLGSTKLNKLLYYLDFISFRDKSKSVTNDTYVSKQYGPVPRCIDEIILKLKTEGLLDVEVIPRDGDNNGNRTKYTAHGKPDLSVFDTYEQTLLDKIAKEFLLWNTEQIVNQTHLEAPWFYSKTYQLVDYKYASDIEFFLAPASPA